MTTYIVTDKSPIDGHQPGDDVTAVYPPDVRDRLVEEGFLAVVEEKPKSRKRKKADETGADEDGD